MTESGQEPPENGRGAPETSGKKLSPKGQASSRRRRRKRRGAARKAQQEGGTHSETVSLRGPDSVEKNGAETGNRGESAGAGPEKSGRPAKTKKKRPRHRHHGPADASRRAPAAKESGSSDSKTQGREGREQKPSHAVRHETSHGHAHRRRQGRGGGKSGPLYAALDLGTNNCRLLIARPEGRSFRVVDAYSRIVRLGEGIEANKRLGEAAVERAIDALAQCHKKLAYHDVQRSRLIATEACRAAENGADFIAQVRKDTGLRLEVISRETEARLAVAGCVSLIDPEADGVILFDIGGGSTEIVWLDLRNRAGARGISLTRFIRSWVSLPVGVVNLAERHGGVEVTPRVFEGMVADVQGRLADDFALGENLDRALENGKIHMLGTSGTVTTLAGIHLGLRRYDRRQVDGLWLKDAEVGGMIDRVREMSYEERVNNACIGVDRADLVLAGCAILEAIRRRWRCSRLRVADRGLREGILTELMAADGAWSQKRDNRPQGNSRNTTRQRGRK